MPSSVKQELSLPLDDKLKDVEKPVLFFERPVCSDRYIFASDLHESDHMNETEWTIYQDWHDWMKTSLAKALNWMESFIFEPLQR